LAKVGFKRKGLLPRKGNIGLKKGETLVWLKEGLGLIKVGGKPKKRKKRTVALTGTIIIPGLD